MKRLGRGLGSLLSEPTTRTGTDQVEVERVKPNPLQPRKAFDATAMDELRASVKQHGILQPVVVRTVGDDFELIAGERRWRVASELGLESIPAVVRDDVSDDEMLELALVENVQRRDLDALEKARGYRALMEQLGLSQEGVAEKVGLKRSTVANHLRLLELPDSVQAMIADGSLSMGHARALLGLEGTKAIERLAGEAVTRGLSVRAVEQAVQGRKKGAASPQAAAAGTSTAKPPWAQAMEARLREALGTRVRVENGSGYRGQIVIDYHGREELERLYGSLAPTQTV